MSHLRLVEPYDPFASRLLKRLRATAGTATDEVKALVRSSRPGRLNWHHNPHDSAAPLAVVGLVETKIGATAAVPQGIETFGSLEKDPYDALRENVSPGLVVAGATRIIASLLHQSEDPFRMLSVITATARTSTGGFVGAVEQDMCGELTEAFVHGDEGWHVCLEVPWRPHRDNRVIDAVINVTLYAIVAFATLEQSFAETDPEAAVEEVVARLRAFLMQEAAAA